MGIETRKRKDGRMVYRVRWADTQGARHCKTFARRDDARRFEADVIRRQQVGELDLLDKGQQTLAEFAREWWRSYAEPNLERSTLKGYAAIWDKHVLPRLGSYTLRELATNPEIVERFRGDLNADGVGESVARKALVILQGVLQRAVEWRHISSNPAKIVRKPSAKRVRAVQPIPPEAIEQMRQRLLDARSVRDATLLCTLAYAGLRPAEALALTWGNVKRNTLLIESALADGLVKRTKTGAIRTVDLLPPLATDLEAWRETTGPVAPSDLVFHKATGGPWVDHDWRNWRRRVFDPAATDTGLTGARPYDLRHSFCSLLIHEGRSVVEIAAQLGHQPTMTLNTYGHVFAEFAGRDRVSAAAEIERARRGHD